MSEADVKSGQSSKRALFAVFIAARTFVADIAVAAAAGFSFFLSDAVKNHTQDHETRGNNQYYNINGGHSMHLPSKRSFE